MTLQILSYVAHPITNPRGLGAQFGNIQHLLHIAQTIRPLRVFRARNRSAGKTAAVILAAELIEKTSTAALAAVLPIAITLTWLAARLAGVVSTTLWIGGSNLLLALTLAALARLLAFLAAFTLLAVLSLLA